MVALVSIVVGIILANALRITTEKHAISMSHLKYAQLVI
jgi:hypothetical protein